MNANMNYWVQWKTKNTTPMSVACDMEADMLKLKDAIKKEDKEAVLDIIYDIYCDAHYFMKDLGVTPEAMEAKLGY